MLDCGEGTLLQLHRQFGRQDALKVLRNLKAIYLSHLHADHHMGLINIVLERTKAFSYVNENVNKLFIIAPSKITSYLSLYHRKFEPILTDLYQVSNEHLLTFTPPNNKEIKTQILYPAVLKELVDGTGLESIKTCRAVHCPSAFSVSLVTKSGFKLVYSGDTRPNNAIVELGTEGNKAPDLLIHEATM
jgi:ribonuclease Z